MEKYERLLSKGTSFAKADEVWRAWYKKTFIHAVAVVRGLAPASTIAATIVAAIKIARARPELTQRVNENRW